MIKNLNPFLEKYLDPRLDHRINLLDLQRYSILDLVTQRDYRTATLQLKCN